MIGTKKSSPHRLDKVIAVVGCDGSGKSTLTADLQTHLRNEYNPQLLYLGQDSGNILKSVQRTPLIGPMIGGFLVRKSQGAHTRNGKSSSPDVLTALAIYGLSKWRRYKFERMLALHRNGAILITDRYPQAEIAGFYFDSSGLILPEEATGFLRWLATREKRLYQEMAAYVPALVIRLNIDAETAHARKPDHKLKMLQEKVRVIPTLTFNQAPILDLDACAPYADVLQAALAAARTALASGDRL